MEKSLSQDFLLADDPISEQRWRALRLNVQTWYERLAQASDGLIYRGDGTMGTSDMITISAFDEHLVGEQLDRMMSWYRGLSSFKGAICWYLESTPPVDLAARLFARGFAPNWQPHWMWCELRHQSHAFALPAGYTLRVLDEEASQQAQDLPYYTEEEALTLTRARRAYAGLVWQLAVFGDHGRQMVGHCALNVTTGEWGVAGLFEMGVVPSARGQGIGTALAQAACDLAHQLGCRHVILNATAMGEPVYRRVGFQSMGYGHTWYLREQVVSSPAPSRAQVTFLEAVGRGDLETLDQVGGEIVKSEAGSEAMDIAVRCRQPEAARWLVEHGAGLDLLSAWELGWRDKIPELLAEHPDLVNLRKGDWHATPLHIAVERNEIELARLLLTVPNDLTIKDAMFNANALGWARHFGRTEIIALIERHMADQARA